MRREICAALATSQSTPSPIGAVVDDGCFAKARGLQRNNATFTPEKSNVEVNFFFASIWWARAHFFTTAIARFSLLREKHLYEAPKFSQNIEIRTYPQNLLKTIYAWPLAAFQSAPPPDGAIVHDGCSVEAGGMECDRASNLRIWSE
jgi:hypothetical protein